MAAGRVMMDRPRRREGISAGLPPSDSRRIKLGLRAGNNPRFTPRVPRPSASASACRPGLPCVTNWVSGHLRVTHGVHRSLAQDNYCSHAVLGLHSVYVMFSVINCTTNMQVQLCVQLQFAVDVGISELAVRVTRCICEG